MDWLVKGKKTLKNTKIVDIRSSYNSETEIKLQGRNPFIPRAEIQLC